MASHVLRLGKDELRVHIGDTLEEDNGNDNNEYTDREKCLEAEPYMHDLVDEAGIYPHFVIFLFIPKLAI
jgi:hypothetical protein